MDMMQIRKMVMAQMAGGAEVIGGISKYQKATVSYALGTVTSANLTFNHNLGVEPKFVIVNVADGETVTVGNLDQYACINNAGYDSLVSPSTGNRSRYVVYRGTSANPVNGQYYLSDEKVVLHQSANTSHWDTNASYTIELWG